MRVEHVNEDAYSRCGCPAADKDGRHHAYVLGTERSATTGTRCTPWTYRSSGGSRCFGLSVRGSGVANCRVLLGLREKGCERAVLLCKSTQHLCLWPPRTLFFSLLVYDVGLVVGETNGSTSGWTGQPRE